MHASSVFAAFVAIIGFAVAGPPACILAALGQQPNPADIKAVCGTLQSNMLSNITEVCSGDALGGAYDVYSSTCLGSGVTVSALPTPTGQTATGTAKATSPGASGTGPSGASQTDSKGGAGAVAPQPLIFAASGLLATGLAAVLFL